MVGALVVWAFGGSYNGLALTLGLAYGVVTVGMVLQLGYSHQLAFSQSTFMGIGAYGVGLLETRYGLSTAESFLSVIVLSALVAVVVGTVVTRAPGLALALVTLLLPLLLYQLATYSSYLGTFTGIPGVNPLYAGSSYTSGLVGSGVIVAGVLGLVSFGAWRLLRSGAGLQLSAFAEDEAMAESLGISLRQRKLEVFVLGSVLSALGGAMVAALQGIVTPGIINLPAELTLLVMLFIGGRRSIPAAILGAVGIEFLSTRAPSVSSHLDIIEGVLLLIVLLLQPEGLAGAVRQLVRLVPIRSPLGSTDPARREASGAGSPEDAGEDVARRRSRSVSEGAGRVR